jgi:hypothetical protein
MPIMAGCLQIEHKPDELAMKEKGWSFFNSLPGDGATALSRERYRTSPEDVWSCCPSPSPSSDKIKTMPPRERLHRMFYNFANSTFIYVFTLLWN